MVIRYTKAFAPATVANVGPGFDVFGFALEKAGDTVEAWRTERKGVRIREITGDNGELPRDPARNVASAVAARILRDVGARFGVEIALHKGLPLGSGLGSSSASAVAAALAMNGLLNGMIAPPTLLDAARYGEFVACGAAHADNVAPALYGGFIVVFQRNPLPFGEEEAGSFDVIRLAPPAGWCVAVIHPHFELPTKKARASLPKTVTLDRMTANVGNASALIAAISSGDIRLAGRALMGDAVVVPARKRLIKGFDAVAAAAVKAGAAGVSISGAGPSLFALTSSKGHAKVVAEKMSLAWRRLGVVTDVLTSRFGAPGARILSTQ
jgi:homoserine kinase